MMRTVVLALIGMVFGIGCGSTDSVGGLTTAEGGDSNNQRQPATNPNETFLIEDLSVKIGEEIVFEVTGSIIGEVYGTDQYTGDSSVSVAVVHAGILKRGQTGKVVLKIVPGDKAYKSSTRNGVRSYNWSEFKFGYTLAKADADAKIQKLIPPSRGDKLIGEYIGQKNERKIVFTFENGIQKAVYYFRPTGRGGWGRSPEAILWELNDKDNTVQTYDQRHGKNGYKGEPFVYKVEPNGDLKFIGSIRTAGFFEKTPKEWVYRRNLID